MGVLRQHSFTIFAFLLFASASVITLFVLVREGYLEAVPGGIWGEKRVGPGSSPLTCRSKCGNCSPCKAVHVPVQPGFSFSSEYYPEAWRCKCGNKLFMP